MTHDEMKRSAWVMVIADSSTFTGLGGCWFAMTTDEEVEGLDSGDQLLSDLTSPHYFTPTGRN
jgi:hypothetical protein